MAAPRHTRAQLLKTLELLKEHGTPNRAARAIGVPVETFRTRLRHAEHLKPEPVPEPEAPLNLPFEEAWRNWMRAIGMAKDRYVPRVGTNKPTSGTRKILVIPDLHAPFHEPEMFAAALARESDADHCICIGDIGDAYALSRFMKYERMPYREEWASVNLCMQAMASAFPTVEIVIGNHDARLEKQLRTHLTEDMVDAVQMLTGGLLCPISAMAKRYPNVRIAHHVTPSGRSVDWFTTIGDAWLGHPERYSRMPGSALRGVEEWLSDNEQALGVEGQRLIIMGHTHTAAVIPWRANKLLVECGCLCKQQGYMLSPRIGGRPQRRGYVTFNQTNGRSDLNSVRFVWLDAEEGAA